MNFEDCYEGQAVYHADQDELFWIEETREDALAPAHCSVLIRSSKSGDTVRTLSYKLTPIPVRADYDKEEIKEKIRELYGEFRRRLDTEIGWDVDRDSLAQIRIYGPDEQNLRHFRMRNVMRPEETSLEDYRDEIRSLQLMRTWIDKNLEWTIESMVERAKIEGEDNDDS